ncbi:MAG TPA: hypothetical protein DCS88_12440 [Alphaproteobacteria bacterium]|nr:hypothetical protein [Alphaproteobacteria bacterium]
MWAGEPGTFDYFYSEPSTIGWIIAGIFAIIAAATIFLTGGVASPIVVSTGTFIGNTAGLSGIAATNYGLALLGGGAIASGGFGMIGGVALLTTTLGFSTDVVFDFAISKASSAYSYYKLVEESKNLLTLPPPLRSTGSDRYEKAFLKIKEFRKEDPVNSNFNQSILKEAINLSSLDGLEDKDELQIRVLLSYLNFATNEYKEAAIQSDLSIRLARKLEEIRTLPAFLFAVSSLYEESPDFKLLNENYFKYALMAEPNNDLIPLLFSIYLSHVELRFKGSTSSYFTQVAEVATEEKINKYFDQVFSIILINYFKSLKIEQQRISSLCLTDNLTIKDSKDTLSAVKKSLSEYNSLLSDGQSVLIKFSSVNGNEDEKIRQINDFKQLLDMYTGDSARLNSLILSLKEYQENITKYSDNIKRTYDSQDESNRSLLIWYVISFLVLLMLVVYIKIKKTYPFRSYSIKTFKKK